MDYYETFSAATEFAHIDTDSVSIVSSKYGPEKSKKKVVSQPQFFKSNINGKRIVYGNTGISTPHIVGSADEDLYFKVKLAIGLVENEPVTLFYDNPRDYCVHYLTAVCKQREKFKEEPPEIFIERVENMLNDMSTIINKWQEKRDSYLSFKLQEAAIRRNNSQKFVEVGGSNYSPRFAATSVSSL